MVLSLTLGGGGGVAVLGIAGLGRRAKNAGFAIMTFDCVVVVEVVATVCFVKRAAAEDDGLSSLASTDPLWLSS